MRTRIKATFRKSFQIGTGPWQTVELGIEEDVKPDAETEVALVQLYNELEEIGESLVIRGIKKGRSASKKKSQQGKLF